MDVARLETLAGAIMALAGLALAVASVTSVGEAQSWDVADAFAADSTRPVRRVGTLLGVMGLAALVAATPVVVNRLVGTAGFGWAAAGWVAFAMGATLFAMVLGLVAVLMPALGELARTGDISPQGVADRLTRQVPIFAAFLGGNLMFLSWVSIGAGMARSWVFPSWVGWYVAASAVAAWLGFLHVPVLQPLGGTFWALGIALLGVVLLRLASGAV